jgi:NADH-quinone oxidoreductase subunit L
LTILYAWVCIFSPFAGAALTPFLATLHPKLRDLGAVFFSLLAALAALSLLPALFHPEELPLEHALPWLSDPITITFGILIDPLSIILANVVAVISFFIMVYCVGYMKGDDAVSRFWMWMNSFIGSMLLLVLANNLLFVFIGWKLVGVCSYGLIGFYYKDEEKYWIGGPAPTKFVTPSQAGIKALVMTGVGDLLMLGGILIIFYYSGTLNLQELYQSSAEWIPQMAQSPGMIILVTILILAGPVGKSAQFPLHEWLPEAMAGPGPVSALIHAATMVKSGVYLVARFIPIFYYGYWVADCQEASLFFIITAWTGAITAFLAATQGMVSKELKKALAYSTVSQIGYMMLGLGVAGLSPIILVGGYTAGIFHLVSHALFKACLFLCAGTIIHAAHSIYMHDMGAMRKYAPFTWLFMMIAALSLIGLPPFPGFWSKDAVLLAVVEANTPLFVVAVVTVIITAFYTTRMIGMVFYGTESQHIEKQKQHNSHFGEGLKVMWIPCGILAILIIAMGLLGLQVEHLIRHGFEINLVKQLGLPISTLKQQESHLMVPLLSVICVLVGALPAYWIYIAKKVSPDAILEKVAVFKVLYRFFWERWYIDSFYNKVIVGGIFAIAGLVVKAEGVLNSVIHQKIPEIFTDHAYNFVRLFKTETRELAFNITYILLFFIIFIGFLLLV